MFHIATVGDIPIRYTINIVFLIINGFIFRIFTPRTVSPISILTVSFDIFFCWKFSRQNSNKYLYYVGTDENSIAAQARVKIFPLTTSVTDVNAICDTTTFSNGDFRVMIKQGTASTEKITCPDQMLATGSYTMTDSSGTNYCTGGTSNLDGCSAGGTLTANLTACSTKIFSSAGGQVLCMYSEDFDSTDPSTNTSYVSVFNTDASVDSSTTHFFTCVVVYSDPNNTQIAMSTHPNYCFNTTYQNATYMSQTGGYTIDWTASMASSSSLSAAIIAAIVIGCLLFIAIVLLAIFLIYNYVYLKDKNRPGSRIVPDTLPNTAMSQADKNKRMMFTPAPPKSAGPGGREGDYYDGGRAGSEVSLHPTVSQLANYRTPTPFISDSKVEEGEIVAEMREGTTPHPGNERPTTAGSQTDEATGQSPAVILVSEGNAKKANGRAAKSGVKFQDEITVRDDDIASPDSQNSLPEADRNADDVILKQAPIMAAANTEIKPKSAEPSKSDSVKDPKLAQKTAIIATGRNEPGRRSLARNVSAKSMSRALVGEGVYTTSAAVLLPGAPTWDPHETDQVDSKDKGSLSSLAVDDVANANKVNDNSSDMYGISDIRKNVEAKSPEKISNSEVCQEIKSASSFDKQSSFENQSLHNAQEEAQSSLHDGNSVEEAVTIPEDFEHEIEMQTELDDIETEANKSIPSRSITGDLQAQPLVVTVPNSLKPASAKQPSRKPSKRPKSSITTTTNQQEFSAKSNRPKSTSGKPNVEKKGGLKKSGPPKSSKGTLGKEDMDRPVTANVSKTAAAGSKLSFPNNTSNVKTITKAPQEQVGKSSEIARPPSATTIISHKSSARPASGALPKTSTPSVDNSATIKTEENKTCKPPTPTTPSDEESKVKTNMTTHHENDGQSSGLTKPLSATTVADNTSAAHSPCTSPSKTSTPSFNGSETTKSQWSSRSKPPPPRTSTPSKKLQSEINKGLENPPIPKSTGTSIAASAVKKGPPTRIKSAAPKRATKDPRDEHNPFADPRAAISTPVAVVRPEDIARIKSAANKRLVHDFKMKTVRTPSQTETPVKGRTRENKKTLQAAWREANTPKQVPNGTAANHTANGKDMDVDSILDYDMKRMGEPDGAESGVMIDMEGSLPVFSESGDVTPEPTRVTPQEKTPRRHKRDKHL
ncbi:hypothetical protein ElyMa_003353200 [Elysia marginata]|uniref:Uncharacterized protein n=1 Tax=Elysia marginata TaxID=1093978 RepID=A0AAV4JI16_9GAST|nr:hypothetical protein ElyMa_003353200 [Elysia marginata]